MNDSNAFDRKIATHRSIGPGGLNCPCCGPAPGKERKKFFRRSKTRLKAFWEKEIKREIQYIQELTNAD